MRALVLERQRGLRLRDLDPAEVPGPGEVKVKVHAVGICGSDVPRYAQGLAACRG